MKFFQKIFQAFSKKDNQFSQSKLDQMTPLDIKDCIDKKDNQISQDTLSQKYSQDTKDYHDNQYEIEEDIESDNFIVFKYEEDWTCVATINKLALFKVIKQELESSISENKSQLLDSLKLSDFTIETRQIESVLIIKKDAPIYALRLELNPSHFLWGDLGDLFKFEEVVVYAPNDGYLRDKSYYEGSDLPLFEIIPTELIHKKVFDKTQTPLDDHFLVGFNGYEFYYNFYKDIRRNFSKRRPPVLFIWNKETGDYVNEGDIIGRLVCNRFNQDTKKSFEIKCRGTGILCIDIEKNEWGETEFESPISFYSLYRDLKTFIKKSPKKELFWDSSFSCLIEEDIFDKSIALSWKKIADRRVHDDYKSKEFYNVFEMTSSDAKSIFISLQVRNNEVFIVFSVKSDELRLMDGDEISLLLQNTDGSKLIIQKVLSNNIIVEDFYEIYDTSYFCPLSRKDLLDLSSFYCTNWRIKFNRSHKPTITGENQSVWTPKIIALILFRKYVKIFQYKLSDLENDYEIIYADEYGDNEEPKATNQPCYVYLMMDTSNGFYKIGMSNNPEYRERTLQSEKPTIEKVCAKEFPNRAIASAIESALHKTYESKRIRGEWFALDADDVSAISRTLY